MWYELADGPNAGDYIFSGGVHFTLPPAGAWHCTEPGVGAYCQDINSATYVYHGLTQGHVLGIEVSWTIAANGGNYGYANASLIGYWDGDIPIGAGGLLSSVKFNAGNEVTHDLCKDGGDPNGGNATRCYGNPASVYVQVTVPDHSNQTLTLYGAWLGNGYAWNGASSLTAQLLSVRDLSDGGRVLTEGTPGQ
jgi:hypothetical protein